MTDLKKGDHVICINNKGSRLKIGDAFALTSDPWSSYPDMLVRISGHGNVGFYTYRFQKIENSITKSNMSLLEKFSVALKAEPEKTFRKAGITNGDDLLTEDGLKIFMSWMLKKHGPDFKKEVVDDLISDDSK